MDAVEPVAVLLQVEHVGGGARRVADVHVPAPGDVRRRGRQRLDGFQHVLAGQHLVDALGDDLLVAGGHHRGHDRDAGVAGSVLRLAAATDRRR